MRRPKTGHIRIDGFKFVSELQDASGKTLGELSASVYRAVNYLSQVKRGDSSISETVFNALCEKYKLDKGRYTNPQPAEKKAVENDATLNSINATMFEILRVLRDIQDDLKRQNGYSANININTSELKKELKEFANTMK